MLRIITLAFIVALLSAPTIFAQPVTETCEDGRIMAVSPFNPEPCETNRRAQLAQQGGTAAEQVEAAALTMPTGFLAVYGPPATSIGWSLADRVARVKYEQDMRYFGGLVDEPEGFDRVADFYQRWGLGRPVFYQGRYGQYCRWPDAPFRPARATMFTAVNGAGVVVASWQVRVIMAGNTLNDLHAFVPPSVRALNQARLAAQQ